MTYKMRLHDETGAFHIQMPYQTENIFNWWGVNQSAYHHPHTIISGIGHSIFIKCMTDY